MKAIDLYAAHALSALISLERGELPMDEDAIAREAHRLAAALAEIMCGNIACSIVDGRCERCGQPRAKFPPPPPNIGPPRRMG